MLVKWKQCDGCIHGEICNRKADYERLVDKIQNSDKNKSYDGFAIDVDCTYYRATTSGLTYGYSVRG